MSKFKDNFSSESFYPDSNYYLDQDNAPKALNNSCAALGFQAIANFLLNSACFVLKI